MNTVPGPDRNSLKLAPQLRSDVALRRILLRELEIMAFNESGILLQQDIECLHDFRVAVRRCRILLSRVPGVIPWQQTKPFMASLVRLGRLTGPCRDLDVLLAQWPEYTTASDAASRAVFDFLQHKRDDFRARLAAEIAGKRHDRFKKNWCKYLTDEPVVTRMRNANKPVADLANELLEKTQRKVIRKLRLINDDSADKKIHKLRIACKRWRYLLDYFHAFGEGGGYKKQIAELKRLQEILGCYQDLNIQLNLINSITYEMTASGLLTPDIDHVVHNIKQLLQQRRRVQHQNVLKAISRFLAGKVCDNS